MIRTERELKAAEQWLEYWRENRSGEQSWIGNEQARQRVAELRRQIDAYKRESRRTETAHAPAFPQRQPEAETRTVNRATIPDSGT